MSVCVFASRARKEKGGGGDEVVGDGGVEGVVVGVDGVRLCANGAEELRVLAVYCTRLMWPPQFHHQIPPLCLRPEVSRGPVGIIL